MGWHACPVCWGSCWPPRPAARPDNHTNQGWGPGVPSKGAASSAPTRPPRVGYVVKRYPRYSETFVVNEILAHEAAGLEVEVFSLNPPNDTHFQDVIAEVRAPVTYVSASGLKAADFWSALG